MFPKLALRIFASDCDPVLLERARIGCYAAGSLKERTDDLRSRIRTARPALVPSRRLSDG